MNLTTISPMPCFVGKDSSGGGGKKSLALGGAHWRWGGEGWGGGGGEIRVAYAGDHMQLGWEKLRELGLRHLERKNIQSHSI